LRILVSWLREFTDVPAGPAGLAEKLSMCGFEVAGVDEVRSAEGQAAADTVIDFEITANRPDCLSVIGMAREASTAYDTSMRRVPPGLERSPERGTPASAEADGLQVIVEDEDKCPRYSAAVADVHVAPSPSWLADRLVAAGVRPINNVVDVTNYVMIELGHPLHAFDLARLDSATLRIRTARPGEQIRTLDGELRTLDPEMLVIADAEHAQAVAGVMGGAESEVWAGTRTIAIESAWFKPTSVRRTGKRLGLKTEASARFERGANINATVAAIDRVCDLLRQTGAGRRRGQVIDCYPSPPPPLKVTLRAARIAHVLGRRVDAASVERILDRLGFAPARVETAAGEGWEATVPSWRVDVTREVDLIEEVARHDGYDRIPATFPPQTTVPQVSDPRPARDRLLRRVMTAAGFSEAITFVFIEAGAAAAFAGTTEPVALAHPLSESFAVLRPSLLPGLVEAVAYNRRRERRDVRLFEVGSRFSAERGETRALGLAWSGAAVPEHWSGAARAVDFFDVKGVVEAVASALRVPLRCARTTVPWLVEGRSASILAADAVVGLLGQLSPGVADARGLHGGEEVYVAEMDLDMLPREEPRETESQPLPRHPSVVRDLSILVDRALPAEAVRGTIVAAAPPTLIAVREFDRYQGNGIPEGQVSLSFHLAFRAADRTLTDPEVQEAMEAVVAALAREHHAARR
jgi:phenylalanyl-tRNA synthetase beta chain